MSGKSKQKIEDLHLHFIVLLNLIIEKIEELEKSGQLFGRVKFFLKNSLKYFVDFINKTYEIPDKQIRIESTQGVFIIQERVEKALINQYVLTENEREARLTNILYDTSLSEDEIHNVIRLVSEGNILKH